MAQGDVENPNAWTSGASTLGVGSTTTPNTIGGLNADAGGGNNGDPDTYLGSFTLKAVPSSLGVGTVAAPTGRGDVVDVYGTPDVSVEPPQQVAGLIAFTTGAGTIGPVSGSFLPPIAHGDVGDVGMSPTPPNEWNDSAQGAGTLIAWSSGASTLSTGSIPQVRTRGDIDAIYSPNEHFAGVNPTWSPGTPTLGLGTVIVDTDGEGDITDPFAWQDTVLYLTSWTYPVVTIENFTPGEALVSAFFQPDLITEAENFTPSLALTGGNIHLALVSYNNYPPENYTTAFAMTGGSLTITTGYVVYSNWPPENYTLGEALTGGSLTVTTGYIVYTNWPPENYTLGLALTGGSLA